MKSFNLKVVTLLIIISVYLVLKWLPGGQIIAGGDVGIPVFSPQKQLNEVASAWWESHATGVTSPITFTAVPFYLTLAGFEKMGIGEDLAQKGLFFLIIFGGSLSIYALALIFNLNKWTALVAALFYIFNLTSLSVWQRGVNNGMLMLLLAPLSLLILAWGIKARKYSFIILINITSFFLSYVFGALGFLFSLWLLWIIYIITALFGNWFDKKARKFILIYFSLLVIFWIGTNLWWIIHLLQSGGYVLGQFSPEELKARGSDVLLGLKPYHNPLYILRGLNAFYLYGVKDWENSYLNPFMLVLSWIPTIIVFSTTLSKFNYSLVFWRFLMVLTALILILSKGLNSPLGLVNAWIYDLFPFLAPLRNPYEKVGILLTIPFSLLFAYGLERIKISFKLRKKSYLSTLSILVAIFCFTFLVWPLWLGKLFVSEGRKYIVSIPPYYTQADSWLKSRIALDDTRILHLPLSWGESVDYNWGYTGVEPSQYFFSGSSIGYQIGVVGVDSRIRDILISVHNQDSLKVLKSLASLNIGWVVMHNETNWKPRTLESPERINNWFSQDPDFLDHQVDFGPLSIYRVKDEYRLGHFYSAGKLIDVRRPNNPSALGIWDEIEQLNDGFFTERPEGQDKVLGEFIEKNIIFPEGKIKYSPFASLDSEKALLELSAINFPGNILGFFNQNDQVRECFSLSSKKLKEAALFVREFKNVESKESLLSYEKQLTRCTKISSETLSIYLNTISTREEILGQLIRQKVVLENEFKNAAVGEEGIKAKEILTEYLANLGFNPKYDLKKQTNDRQIIFNYQIVRTGQYDIKINDPDKKLLDSPPKIIQIDNQSVEVSPSEIAEKYIKYPSVKFDKGFHEIILEAGVGENIIEKSLEEKKISPDVGFKYEQDATNQASAFLGEARNTPITLTFDILNLDIESSYEVSFDMKFYQGSRPVMTITHDTDPLNSAGQIQPAVVKELDINNYPTAIKDVRLNYNPLLNANKAKLAFTLMPVDLQNPFVGSTKALISNIRVEKNPGFDLVLEENNALFTKRLGSASLKWNKINQTSYELNLSNQETPYILVFAETFHPLWQIKEYSGKKIDLPHFSINGFANGWFVENPLPGKIKVEFVLQNNFKRGILIAAVIFITSIFILFYLDHRRKVK